mmetsp:Transcript_23929/g.44195  ORF Transcript_23929/g.44195 Transcript_23929/m.44195 type:complete len:284 (+) Transcript_23929:487-1338(+)
MSQQGLLLGRVHGSLAQPTEGVMELGAVGADLHVSAFAVMGAVPGDVRIALLARTDELVGRRHLERVRVVRAKVVVRLEPEDRMTDRHDELDVREVGHVILESVFRLELLGTLESVLDPPSVVCVSLVLDDRIVSIHDLLRTVTVHGANFAVVDVRLVGLGEVVHEEGRAALGKVDDGEVEQPRDVAGDLSSSDEGGERGERFYGSEVGGSVVRLLVVGRVVVVRDIVVVSVVLLVGVLLLDIRPAAVRFGRAGRRERRRDPHTKRTPTAVHLQGHARRDSHQ